MYYLFHAFGFLGAAVYVFLLAPGYGFRRLRAVVFVALTYASVYAVMLLLFFFITGKFGGQNIVRVFIFVPPIATLYAAALNMDIGRALDIMAPVPCIAQGISHFGCLFPGCCQSWLVVDWGIYNEAAGKKLFPVQICEAVTALIIVAVLILIAKRSGYNSHGRTMPIMLLLFGSTRFGWEFLRNNDKLFLNISGLALWAAATALIGALWLITDAVVRRKCKKRKQSKIPADLPGLRPRKLFNSISGF